MGFIMSVYTFMQVNGPAIIAVMFAAWPLAEIIVRITPTKTDDTALERVGKLVKAVLAALRVPNNVIGVEKPAEVKAAPAEDSKAA